jgi:ABC-2 type transport system ATP-binding protein
MSELLLTIHDLHKSFGRHEVLRGINLSVAPAMLVGIVGENGSGKSTLLRILAGELRSNRGEVFLRGAMGYCPQTVNLNDELTVNQHLAYFRAAYNVDNLCRADELIKQLSYQQYRKELVGKLSGGTRQKLNLTLALMHDPSVLLLDEPYQGFDWETYLHFWEVAADLRERRCAVLVISHLIFDEQRFDRVYRLQDGVLHETTRAR